MAVPCCNFKSKICSFSKIQLEHKQQEVTEGIFLFSLTNNFPKTTWNNELFRITEYLKTVVTGDKGYIQLHKLLVRDSPPSFLPGVSFGVHFGVDSIATLSLFLDAPRISIRGCVRRSVRRSVGPSVTLS